MNTMNNMSAMNTMKDTTRYLPWLMWTGPLLFFAYQFVMRVAPGLVMPELMQKFQIDATAYGLFASLYYFGYAGMQIPVALFLDRFGPKKVITLSVLLCSVGTLSLVFTDHWWIALCSRFLIGAGSAAGFLGASKVISLWFPKQHYTRMVGLTFTFGLMGALYGGKPVSSLIASFGWETVLMLVGVVGFGLALFIFMILRESASEVASEQEKRSVSREVSLWQELKSIVCNKELILIAASNFLMVGALEGFADVWGVPYLVATRGISKSDAALLTSTIFFGMIFGGPLLAYLSSKLKSETVVTIGCGFLMAFIFALMLGFNLQLTDGMLYVLLFITGILCCYQVLVFSIGVGQVPLHLTGITVAFLNCVNMLGGSFFHSSIGHLMDYFWTGELQNGVKVYEANAYVNALAIIPLAAVVGSVVLMMVRYKKGKNLKVKGNAFT